MRSPRAKPYGRAADGALPPVGFRAIRLDFELETDASQDELDTLLKLTERYCVVFQSLAKPPELSASIASAT